MKSPYDTLGVPKDATKADIKRAFKQKAKKHHPDRTGGSAEAMSEINVAYSILSNPGRRSQFDSGGSTTRMPTPDENARSLIMQAVLGAIDQTDDNVDVLRVAYAKINNELHGVAAARGQMKHRCRKMERRLKRIKGPKDNFIAFGIQAQIDSAKDVFAKMDTDEAVFIRAIEMLKDFSFDEEELKQARLGRR